MFINFIHVMLINKGIGRNLLLLRPATGPILMLYSTVMETTVCCQVKDVSSENEDPGAAPYGNFINYYTFNPPDNRLSLVPSSLLQDLGYGVNETVVILDVGCNSGVRTSLNTWKINDDRATFQATRL